MNWYKGNIAEAVALSKTKNAVFVVYVEGKDEATVKLGNFINDLRIREKLESDDFIAIKIEGESESYMQFASIFQIVPVPSLFFIGKSGTPLDIATAVLNSVEELEEKIVKVLLLVGKKPATNLSVINDFIQGESKASSSTAAGTDLKDVKKDTVEENIDIVCKQREDKPDEAVKKNNVEENNDIVCKGDVCFKKPNENKLDEQTKTNQDEETKLVETRKYLEQKRRERIEEEKRIEKERELRRRKEGKEIQNLQAWQKDHELKELKENIKREKLEEQAARERIRAQIAADKTERAHKFAVDTQATSSESANDSNNSKASASDESRLQFRLASGVCNNHNFKCSTLLAEIRDYVKRELLDGTGIKEFTLATTYPKRVLDSEYDTKTLAELELCPSAVILIIGKEATGPTAIISRNGGLLNMVYVTIMAIFNPIFSAFVSAKNWFTGKRNDSGSVESGAQKRSNEDQNQQNDVSKRRNLDRFLNNGNGNTTGTSTQATGVSQGGAYRRYAGESNIHRLSDNRKDSDDENATWNGNSTQQQ